MSKDRPNSLDAARGASLLITDAVEQIVRIVEAMHSNIAAPSAPLGPGNGGGARGISGLVYKTIRLVNSGVRTGMDTGLGIAAKKITSQLPAQQWDVVSSALNGVLGDYLEETANPLALEMRFRADGKNLPADLSEGFQNLQEQGRKPGRRVLLAIHGLCLSDQQWARKDHSHVDLLAAEFDCTPVYLRYNSGRHISRNGRELAGQLEQLLQAWPGPLDELLIITHSMGGLVARSALHYAHEAGLGWPSRLSKLIFLGTPHHGAPLERRGNWLETTLGQSPYTAPLARLGMLRSSGVTDLRHGCLLDEDWQGRDRFESGSDPRRPVPLPAGICCYAAAATTSRPTEAAEKLRGDGLVPVKSAFGDHENPEHDLNIPEQNRWLGFQLNHMDMLNDAALYGQLRQWLAEPEFSRELG